MAIASVSPSFTGKDQRLALKESRKRGNLSLVPRSVEEKSVDRKTFAIFLTSVAVAGLLALLTINTALSQGAFELMKLNAQATTLSDQREAVMKKIAQASSPAVLAYRAKAVGMVPSQSPRFLTVGSSAADQDASSFSKANR